MSERYLIYGAPGAGRILAGAEIAQVAAAACAGAVPHIADVVVVTLEMSKRELEGRQLREQMLQKVVAQLAAEDPICDPRPLREPKVRDWEQRDRKRRRR